MNFEQVKQLIAKKYNLGNTLITGHKASYFEEAAELYVEYKLKEVRDKFTVGTNTKSKYRIKTVEELNLVYSLDDQGYYHIEKGITISSCMSEKLCGLEVPDEISIAVLKGVRKIFKGWFIDKYMLTENI